MHTTLDNAPQGKGQVTARSRPAKSVLATIYVLPATIAKAGIYVDRSRTALEYRRT